MCDESNWYWWKWKILIQELFHIFTIKQILMCVFEILTKINFLQNFPKIFKFFPPTDYTRRYMRYASELHHRNKIYDEE